MSTSGNDLVIQILFDELRIIVCHEGKAGDLALQQATIMQMTQEWRELVASTFTITKAPDEV